MTDMIRTILFYLVSIISLIVFSVPTILLSPALKPKTLQYLLTRYNVFVLWCSERICGIRYEIEGLDNIQNSPMVVLCNHQSSLETFLLQTLFTPLSTVLKQELLTVPFFSWGARKMNAIPLDRARPAQAYKQLIKEGSKRISDNRSVLIFPEGTRVSVDEKVKFNRGGSALAHHTKAPIIPVAHNSGLRISPKRFVIRPGVITVRIGKPIDSSLMSKRELYEASTQWIEHQRDLLI